MNKVHRNMAVYLARNLEFSNRRLTKKDRNRVAQVAYNLVSYGYGFKTSCGSFTSLHRWIKQLNSTIGEGHKLNPLNWNHSGSVSSIKNMEENYDGYICELYCDCLDSGRRAISVSPSTNPARRTRCNSLWWVRHLCRPYLFFERECSSPTVPPSFLDASSPCTKVQRVDLNLRGVLIHQEGHTPYFSWYIVNWSQWWNHPKFPQVSWENKLEA